MPELVKGTEDMGWMYEFFQFFLTLFIEKSCRYPDYD